MKKEDKQKWIEALESGKYPKGIGALIQKEKVPPIGYCCFGVLGVINNIGITDNGLCFIEDIEDSNNIFNNLNETLYPVLEKRFNINRETQSTLYRLNDSTMGFEEVVEYIKENIPEE